jgi:hypothetical protein
MSTVQWAYSGIKCFQTCAKMYYHKYVAKDVKDPPGPEAAFGTAVHKSFEEYLREGTPFPAEHVRFLKYAEPVKQWKGDFYVEHKMALYPDFTPCDFFDRDYFVRGVVDLAVVNGRTANVLDWKTGKSAKYADLKQLELMSLLLFKHFPELEKTRCGLVFVVPDKLVKAEYTRDREKEAWQNWLFEVAKVQNCHSTGKWLPNPNNLCRRHCPVKKCQFNGG